MAQSLAAQSNTVPGLNGRLTSISSMTVWGGNATHIGCSAQNDMCNVGSVNIPWHAAMAENHPKFGFMVARVSGDRIEQVSDRSFCKHAFTSINFTSVCGPCQDPGTGSLMGVGCADIYGVGNNGDRFWLGPAHEIDPWLGTWNHVGSYFDQGDPNVGPPGNNDGIRSPNNVTDPVRNRVAIRRSDLGTAGATYWYQIHLLHEGEAVANRGDNLMTRGVTFSPSGSNWNSADVGGTALGSILTRWPGAQVTSDKNGNDDGRIFVAVKVTGPTAGLWHYEYAVHNVDNSRGAATFRVPVCSAATVSNITFRDIDDDSLNQWIATRQGNELVFTAPANNPLDWNTIYNFGFDCSLAPIAGAVAFDEARLGPGAFSFRVGTQTPAVGPTSTGTVTYVGNGCGAPAPILVASGLPAIPNGSFSMQVLATPGAGMLAVFSFGGASLPIGIGCTQYLDPASIGVHSFLVANGLGFGHIPLPIPNGIQPFTLHWQVATLQAGGPVMGQLALTNAMILQSTIQGGSCP
jgi:hypothetical protein